MGGMLHSTSQLPYMLIWIGEHQGASASPLAFTGILSDKGALMPDFEESAIMTDLAD